MSQKGPSERMSGQSGTGDQGQRDVQAEEQRVLGSMVQVSGLGCCLDHILCVKVIYTLEELVWMSYSIMQSFPSLSL